jgi:hypothetical protein
MQPLSFAGFAPFQQGQQFIHQPLHQPILLQQPQQWQPQQQPQQWQPQQPQQWQQQQQQPQQSSIWSAVLYFVDIETELRLSLSSELRRIDSTLNFGFVDVNHINLLQSTLAPIVIVAKFTPQFLSSGAQQVDDEIKKWKNPQNRSEGAVIIIFTMITFNIHRYPRVSKFTRPTSHTTGSR